MSAIVVFCGFRNSENPCRIVGVWLESSNSSHWFGLIGECFNFVGALILTLDVFLRGRERRRERKLAHIAAIAREDQLNRTTYEGTRVSSADFPHTVLDRRATLIAYLGSVCLAIGFSLLIVHHSLEIRHSDGLGGRSNAVGQPTNVGNSETKK